MTVIALTGSSPAIVELRRRLTASPLGFELTDDAADADLRVTDEAAPTPNHLGVAAAAIPHTFFVREDTVDYVAAALTEAQLAGAYGAAVRLPVQNRPDQPVIGLRSRLRKAVVAALHRRTAFDPSHYDWFTEESVEAEVFDDEVRVTVRDEQFTGRLRARGHIDGNDGRFHWAGILHSDHAAELKRDGRSRAQIAVGDGPAFDAKLAELTPWGTVRMTGVDAAPWMTPADH
ncbi:hypothetical protein GOHSU_04_00650 [Gordonia hirsuta DSM 44140 = NBRC 16056]|uniref:DUF4873 domain-containing protein n=1 Tax=Gordonia hirsuta DSM 44140 = NBRC 16056 TaxID=1121927 RepID=L7L610_9ACTN|nr:DUF4873 domain-containing protein [Gordonia hirsuta]GAC56196.1 hypothetical protein GOHSU_04_00650 [Gordonia hirsuta DSM 44140 = NBRC 16056]